jgi:H+/Cl- antiporter ClcA
VSTLLWAVPVGIIGALLAWAVRWVGLSVRPLVHRNRVPVTVGVGALIGITAMAYQLVTGKGFSEVLFSGQDALPDLVANAADYSVATLVVLGLCKMLAYGLSLSAFRGGPVFPAMFVGAVLGIAMSGLPGMSLAPAIGMGIGAMCCSMLRLPLTSVLLAVVLLGSDGLQSTPEVIVAVVVAFVISTILPTPGPPQPVEGPAPGAPEAASASGSATATVTA